MNSTLYLITMGADTNPPPILSLQKRNVLVNRRSAQIAHSRKFADIQMTAFVCRVVAKEDCGNIVLPYTSNSIPNTLSSVKAEWL